MQIKLASKELVELSGNNGSALIAFPDAKVPDISGLIFGPHIMPTVVSRPGEYEFAEVGMQALETKAEHVGVAELYNVEIEGIDTLFVMDGFGDLGKEDWDLIGDVEVMVVSLRNKPQGLEKLINRMIPYVVIAIDAESEAEAEKLLGLKPLTSNDKFKFTDKDFLAEDPATVLYLMK